MAHRAQWLVSAAGGCPSVAERRFPGPQAFIFDDGFLCTASINRLTQNTFDPTLS
jgi:hypothetical protein